MASARPTSIAAHVVFDPLELLNNQLKLQH
jgi:hypothetical protein